MQIGNTTITPLNKQEQLTLSCDSDNLSERDEAEADVRLNLVFLINFRSPIWRLLGKTLARYSIFFI